MKNRFESVERTSQSAVVEELVLFGDKMDVKLNKANKITPVKSQGGTISFQHRYVTSAFSGIYHHSIVRLKNKDDGWFNLICHESVDEVAVGKFLCGVSGHDDHNEDNVWSRYDWCHYRNWRCKSDDDDEDENANKKTNVNEEDLDEDVYNDDLEDEESDEDLEERSMIHFVSVNKEGQKVTEIGRITMGSECIQADWNYGMRMVDPDTKLAYAYVFGDALVNIVLMGYEAGPRSDFNVSMAKFLPENSEMLGQ